MPYTPLPTPFQLVKQMAKAGAFPGHLREAVLVKGSVARKKAEEIAKQAIRDMACQRVTETIAEGPPYRRITTLNMGLGRDSLTMLLLLAYYGGLRAQGQLLKPSDIDAIVFSDTGAEWQYTYDLIPVVRKIAREIGVPFYILYKPREESFKPHIAERRAFYAARVTGKEKWDRGVPWRPPGSEDWSIQKKARSGWYHLRPPIMEDFKMRDEVGTWGDASCTVNNKVDPIRKFIADLAREKYGVKNNAAWGKLVQQGVALPHLALVGIAADEKSRAVEMHYCDPPGEYTWNEGRGKQRRKVESDRPKGWPGPWYAQEAYPLLEMGITKEGEANYLAAHGLDTKVYKSGCMSCHYQGPGWYWVLQEAAVGNPEALKYAGPEQWAEVLAYEANRRKPLLGKPMEEAVLLWREKNPTVTIEQIMRKGYDHGVKPADASVCASGGCPIL